MKSRTLIFSILIYVLNAHAQSPNWTMSVSNGGEGYDWGQCVAADASGNSVVVGAFYSTTITFGNTVLTNPNPGRFTSFFVKYTLNGNIEWAKQPITNGTNFNRATDVEIDDNGYIYILGEYGTNTITFDTIILTKPDCCNWAKFIVKYDPAGNIIWAITTNGEQQGGVVIPPEFYNEPVPLCKMSINKVNGDIFLAGTFDTDSAFFGSTVLANATTITSNQFKHDVFIAKYDSSGNFIWAKSIGGDRHDYASDISVINADVFVTGSFNSNFLNIGSSNLTNPNQSGTWDHYLPFVAKYDSAGNPQWASQGHGLLTGTKSSRGKSISTDLNGNCFLTGEFEGPFIIFENDTLFNTDTLFSGESSKIFVLKYSSLGFLTWSKTFANGIGNDWVTGIQCDGAGNIYLIGGIYSNAFAIDSLIIPSSGNGIFITKLNPVGGLVWIETPNGSFNDDKFLTGLYVSDTGSVFLSGSFQGSICFGSDTLISNGNYDILSTIILNCSPSFSPITAQGNTTFCQGDSVILTALPGYNSYQWYRRNYLIPGATSMNYSAKNNGKYWCKSQNTTLCIDTSNVIIVSVPCIPIGPNQERETTNGVSEESAFQISPNPGSGEFLINSSGGQLQIFNSFGKLIFSKDITKGKSPIDISSNSNGIYFVTFLTGETKLSQKLLLVQ